MPDIKKQVDCDLPTGAQIKTLYEAEADTNEFSDAEQTKLAGL